MESKGIFSKLAGGLLESAKKAKPKKIIAARIENSVRVALQRTFLPLLIEVFELKGQMQSLIAQKKDPRLKVIEKPVTLTPDQVIDRMRGIQENVEETMRWCEGLLSQLKKGIEEAEKAK